MLGQHQQKINNIRLKGILSVDTTTPFTPKSHQKVVELSNGSRLIDTEQKTSLVLDGQTLATWPTERWILLGVSLDEQTAFFEADDSWLLARLNLDTGIFRPDDDPLFLQYVLESDDNGLYVLDDLSLEKYYLK
jgi:hypothetical protein